MTETVKARTIVINYLSDGGLILTHIRYVRAEDVERLLDLANSMTDVNASDGREVRILHGELREMWVFLSPVDLARLLAESVTAMELVVQ